jgi:hypothetical protein
MEQGYWTGDEPSSSNLFFNNGMPLALYLQDESPSFYEPNGTITLTQVPVIRRILQWLQPRSE